jgi:hypothetical protein
MTAETIIWRFASPVIARSEATKQSSAPCVALDCFASLAMTSAQDDAVFAEHLT